MTELSTRLNSFEFSSLGKIFGTIWKAEAFPGSVLYQNIPVGAGESPFLIKCSAPTGMGWMWCRGARESGSSQAFPQGRGGRSFVLYISRGLHKLITMFTGLVLCFPSTGISLFLELFCKILTVTENCGQRSTSSLLSAGG